jgi:hypothetical protein
MLLQFATRTTAPVPATPGAASRSATRGIPFVTLDQPGGLKRRQRAKAGWDTDPGGCNAISVRHRRP